MGLRLAYSSGGDDMETLTVTAELHNGFVSADPWSPALDGILAYQVMRSRLGDELFALSSHRVDLQQPVEGLPLTEESFGDFSWYQCSFPEYDSITEVTRHTHRRFDSRQAERFWNSGKKSGKVLVAAGPYKNSRLKLRHHITAQVCWFCVGNADEIERLLSGVTHIGSRRGAGFGRVRSWRVESSDCMNKARFNRALPVGYAERYEVRGAQMHYGLKPPVRHPDNKTLCVMPGYE